MWINGKFFILLHPNQKEMIGYCEENKIRYVISGMLNSEIHDVC